MQEKQIQWFPGHMAKTRRIMQEALGDVDVLFELLDARIPRSSENPEIAKIAGEKPRILILNKSSLADPAVNRAWLSRYAKEGRCAVLFDCVTGEGLTELKNAVATLLSDKLARYRERGMEGRRIRAMVVGIPNVGKSTLINRLAGGKRAKAENRPGVTRVKQWISTDYGFSLLDMPGVLAPKFPDRRTGENLAVTGAIREEILDMEEIGMILASRLTECAGDLFRARYKLTPEETEGLDSYDLLTLVGKKRGFLMSGGEVNLLRAAETLVDEFRAGKIGRISLERPKEELCNA